MPSSAAEQVGQMLAVSKRQGIDFDRAWTAALSKVRHHHATPERREWKMILDESRRAFERGYRDQDVPGGPAALALHDLLLGENHQAHPVRERPLSISSSYADQKSRSEAA